MIGNDERGKKGMRFRPCIDIHNGKVKQIVGSSLRDAGDQAVENYISEQDASYYARLYREKGLRGGHVILLNASDSPYFQQTRSQALQALQAYPGGLQIGGGIRDTNACFYLEQGASHVIVTSFVFQGGVIRYDNLEKLVRAIGREHLVLDLSCRKKDGVYYVVTDRWQTFTREAVTPDLLERLADYCDEFLVHAVDVEGKNSGIQEDLAFFLGEYSKIPVTYAGGVRSMEDMETLNRLGNGRVDATVGSALDLFGGSLSFQQLCQRWRG